MEKYTGVKMDAATPGVAAAAGVDAVAQMTDLPGEISRMVAADRALIRNVWTQLQHHCSHIAAAGLWVTLGLDDAPQPHNRDQPDGTLRQIKDQGEIESNEEGFASLGFWHNA